MKKALLLLFAAAAAGGLLYWALGSAQELPDEPQPIAWDRDTCAHCRMLVSEKAHAAQLVTEQGQVHAFDDPGCALEYVAERDPAVHKLWFYSDETGGWLSSDEVGFAPAENTPMGYGIEAVPGSTEGAMSPSDAREQVLRTPPEASP